MPMFWFTGVVEDRLDPEQMGRVRVRIFGIHTDDITKISTGDLPWANVMMPVTSASITGVGVSPTGLVEGSWVVGFFADGDNAQDPIIMGSLPSRSTQSLTDLKAFKDPNGKFPRWFNETDVSKVARESTWKTHASYSDRYLSKVSGVEIATSPTLSTTTTKTDEDVRTTWDEPEPRDGFSGIYPFVHTYETESGIVREYDDTPNASRVVEYHPAGTFYEVYSDGKKTSKVVGDNFEIIIKNDNILVRGKQNITIEGNATQLIKGDYTVEVVGDYNLKVHGGRNTKITKNDNIEIIGNSNTNIKESMIQRVGKDQTLLVDANKTETIGGSSNLAVTGAVDYTFLDTFTVFSTGAQAISTNSTQKILSKSGLTIDSDADCVLTCNANTTFNTSGNVTLETGGSFTSHSVAASSFTSDTTSNMTSAGAFGITASRIDLN